MSSVDIFLSSQNYATLIHKVVIENTDSFIIFSDIKFFFLIHTNFFPNFKDFYKLAA